MTPQEKIQANAAMVVKQLSPSSGMEDFGYNNQSVEWLDGFIEWQRGAPGVRRREGN